VLVTTIVDCTEREGNRGFYASVMRKKEYLAAGGRVIALSFILEMSNAELSATG
jgi:hypothetical protein